MPRTVERRRVGVEEDTDSGPAKDGTPTQPKGICVGELGLVTLNSRPQREIAGTRSARHPHTTRKLLTSWLAPAETRNVNHHYIPASEVTRTDDTVPGGPQDVIGSLWGFRSGRLSKDCRRSETAAGTDPTSDTGRGGGTLQSLPARVVTTVRVRREPEVRSMPARPTSDSLRPPPRHPQPWGVPLRSLPEGSSLATRGGDVHGLTCLSTHETPHRPTFAIVNQSLEKNPEKRFETSIPRR